MVALAAGRASLPSNFDSWGGFRVARRRCPEDTANANVNLVVLAGDSHNAWVNNLEDHKTAMGVEFTTHSVTPPGHESDLPRVSPDEMASTLLAANPHRTDVDASRRG